MFYRKCSWMLVAVLMLPAALQANLIVNGDFQASTDGMPDDWTTHVTNESDFQYKTTGGPDGVGDAYVVIHGIGNPGTGGAWWQSARFDVEEGQEYHLSLSYQAASSDNGFIRVNYFDGFTYLDADQMQPKLQEADVWTEVTYTFTAPANATRAEVQLRKTDWGGNHRFDDVSVTQVPEPMSLTVVGLSAMMLMRRPFSW